MDSGARLSEIDAIDAQPRTAFAMAYPLADARPEARAFHAASLVGTRLYIFGGLATERDGRSNEPQRLLNDLHFYDVARGGWSGELKRQTCCFDGAAYDAMDPRPSPRAYAGAATIGQRLYVFGGLSDAVGLEDGAADEGDYSFNRTKLADRTMSEVHFYDETTASWSGAVTTYGGAPGPRSASAVASYCDLLVIFGGIDGEGVGRSGVSVLNVTTRHWTVLGASADGSSPAPRGYAGFMPNYSNGETSRGATLYVHGGASALIDDGNFSYGALVFADTWALAVDGLAGDAPAARWTKISEYGVDRPWSAIAARARHSSVYATRGVLYTIGGCDADGLTVSSVGALALDAAPGAAEWVNVSRESAPLPPPRLGATATAYDGGRLLLQFGGFENAIRRKPTDSFYVSSRAFLARTPLQTGQIRTLPSSPDSGLVVFRVVEAHA